MLAIVPPSASTVYHSGIHRPCTSPQVINRPSTLSDCRAYNGDCTIGYRERYGLNIAINFPLIIAF